MKICTTCKEEKDDKDFYKFCRSKDGLTSACKKCQNKCRKQSIESNQSLKEKIKQYKKKYRIENREKDKKYQNQRYQEKKDKIQAQHKDYYNQNKEKIKEYQVQQYTTNIEHIKCYQKAYRKRNALKIRKRHREYVKNNINRLREKDRERYTKKRKDSFFLLKTRVWCLIKMSLKNKGFSKSKKTTELLGCTVEVLKKHLGLKPEGNYQLDHICPCAQAQNEEELIKLQHYTNLRWLKAEDNLAKSNNWTLEGEELCRNLLHRDWIYKESKYE